MQNDSKIFSFEVDYSLLCQAVVSSITSSIKCFKIKKIKIKASEHQQVTNTDCITLKQVAA